MFTFVPLVPEHLPVMHAWFARPHVIEWWTRGESFTFADIEAKYGPLTRGEDEARGYLIERDGPIGYIQYYPVASSFPEGITSDANPLFADHPRGELAGVDLFIAEPQLLGRGVGTDAIRAFLARCVFPHFRAAVIDPLACNARAICAFEKAGFARTDASEDPEHLILVATR